MSRLPDELPISTIEDLTPERPPAGRWFGIREALLGIFLLVGVLGYSGYDWWQSEHKAGNYRLGQQAWQAQEWEEALNRFRQLAGYKDADQRAEEARRIIVERDRQYKVAADAAQAGGWAEAFQAVHEVQEVAGDYRDIEKIGEQAERQVYSAALEGAIAMRVGLKAKVTGLYYRTLREWVYLERSDRWSRLLNWPDRRRKRFVYDVPGPGWRPNPTPSPTPAPNRYVYPEGSPEKEGRRLMLASVEGEQVRFTPLAFDPADYHFYRVGERGVWALKYVRESSAQGDAMPRRTMQGFADFRVDYQGLGSPTVATLHTPSQGWTIADFSGDGDHFLLADLSQAQSPNPASRLYIAHSGRGDRRLIYTYPGDLGSAHLSPDGRWVLVTAFTREDRFFETASIVLLETRGQSSPVVLAQKRIGGGEMVYPPSLAAGFQRDGPLAGKVVVADRNYRRDTTFSVIDPAAPGKPLAVVKTDERTYSKDVIWAYADEGEEEAALVWRSPGVVVRREGRYIILNATKMVPQTETHTARVLVSDDADDGHISLTGVKGSNLLFQVIGNSAAGSGERPLSIYSVPMQALEGEETKATLIYKVPPERDFVLLGSGVYYGPGMLAYTQEGELHARTYDGKFDVKLESGVTALFSPGPFDGALWLR